MAASHSLPTSGAEASAWIGVNTLYPGGAAWMENTPACHPYSYCNGATNGQFSTLRCLCC